VKRRTLGLIGVVAHLIAAGVPAAWLFTTKAAAQSPQAQARSVPVFEVDPAWPKLPPQFKLGDASSFAIDAQDNVWLLHRPRTLKPEDSGKAAPAIVVFDAAGNFLKAWGGAGSGYDWPEREHGIHIDHKGFVWIGGNNCPTSGLAGLKPVADDAYLKFTPDGKFVLQIGRSNQSKGDADTVKRGLRKSAKGYWCCDRPKRLPGHRHQHRIRRHPGCSGTVLYGVTRQIRGAARNDLTK